MKQRILYVLLLLLCLVQASCVKEDILSEQPQEQPFAPKELLVKFSPEVADMIADAEPTRSGKVTRSGAPSVDVVMELIGAYDLERVFRAVGRGDRHGGVRLTVALDVGVDLDDILAAVLGGNNVLQESHGAVQIAQTQNVVELHALAGGDVVDNNTVLYRIYVHTVTSKSFKISAILIYFP